eukprot:m.43668 g.43668  ORF g.43668 m.43668 type:complete len:793 (+) comp10566_c0_seq1:30-2408(+)
MTSQVKFSVLSEETEDGVHSHLLQLDNFSFLIDCGWSQLLDESQLDRLKSVCASVDVVLLSHSDMSHLGAYVYAFTHLGLTCPCYATEAVHSMGQLAVFDNFECVYNSREFDLFSVEDIVNAFKNIQTIKYKQTVTLPSGITFNALCAGHLLGGSVWKINKDGEDIVYAVDYNHRKDTHLPKTTMDTISRPSILITDTLCASTKQVKSVDIVNTFNTTLQTTLRRGGDVLMLSDSSGRCNEALLLLEKFSCKEGMNAYNYVFFSSCAESVVDEVAKLVDFVREDVDFSLRNVQIVKSLDEVKKMPSPKVVLTSLSSLEFGPSRVLFKDMCVVDSNTVLFTEEPPRNTLGHSVWAQRENGNTIQVDIFKRVELEGDELEEYNKRKSENTQKGIGKGGEGVDENANAVSDGVKKNFTAFDGEEDGEEDDEEEDDEMDSESDNDNDELLQNEADNEGEEVAEEQQGKEKEKEKHQQQQPLDGEANSENAPKAKHKRRRSEIYKRQKRKRRIANANAFFANTVTDSVHAGVEWDDYGAVVDMSRYKLREIAAAIELQREVEDEEDEDEDDILGSLLSHTLYSIPTKVVKDEEESNQVTVVCQVSRVDLEGRTNSESLRRIVSNMKPRHIVLVGADTTAGKLFASYCEKELSDLKGGAMIARNGDTLNVTSERSIQQVKLRDTLVTSLGVCKADHFDVSWVDAVLVPNSSDENAMAELDVDPEPGVHDVVFVGDLQLSKFKTFLIERGFEARFVLGPLVVDDVVMITKNAQGFQVDGVVCETYYKVRDLLYNQFAIA